MGRRSSQLSHPANTSFFNFSKIFNYLNVLGKKSIKICLNTLKRIRGCAPFSVIWLDGLRPPPLPSLLFPAAQGRFVGLGLCFLQPGRSGALGSLGQGEDLELARCSGPPSLGGWEQIPHCWCFAALWWQHAVAHLGLKPGSCFKSLVAW